MQPGAPARPSTKPPRRRLRVRSESDRKKHAGWRSCPRCLRSVSTNGRNFYHHMHKCDPSFFADTIARIDASRAKLPSPSPPPPLQTSVPNSHSAPLLSPTTPPRPPVSTHLTDNQRAVFTQQLCFLRIYDRTVDSVFRHLESTNARTFTASAFEAVRVAKTPRQPSPLYSPALSTPPARSDYPYSPLPLPDTFASPLTPNQPSQPQSSSSRPPASPFSTPYPPHHNQTQQQPQHQQTSHVNSNLMHTYPQNHLPPLSQAIASAPYSLSSSPSPSAPDPSSTQFKYPATSSVPTSSTTYPVSTHHPPSLGSAPSHTPPSSGRLSPVQVPVEYHQPAPAVTEPATVKVYEADKLQRSTHIAVSVSTPTSISASVSAMAPILANSSTGTAPPSSDGKDVHAYRIPSSSALPDRSPMYKGPAPRSTHTASAQANMPNSEVQSIPADSLSSAARQASTMSIFSVINK